jgi:hypothetical protein
MKKSLSELATGWEPGKSTLSYGTASLLLSLEVLSGPGTRYEYRRYIQNTTNSYKTLDN